MGLNPRLAPHMAKMQSNMIFSLLPKLSELGFISFAPGAPDAAVFPFDDILGITRDLLGSDPGGLLQYGVTEGYPPARDAMAKLISGYGLAPKADEIIVTTGGQQAIELLCKMFIEPGDVALVESPTYSAALQILKSLRAQVIPIESDSQGIIPEDLEEKIKIFTPKIVYIVPTFKNPSGATISYERRSAVAEITGRLNVLLIEDDPYRDLRYEGDHLPTIKSFDRSGNIVFLTSTSKILCPGLRVAAAYLPEALIPYMTIAKQAADMHSATLPQAIAGEYIRRGLLGGHISKLCSVYKARRDLMLACISESFPKSIDVAAPMGGLFIWCVCPDGTNTTDLLEQALERKVAYIPGEQFFADGRGKNTFRLNFTSAAQGDISKGIEILGQVLRNNV
ncbi:MAG: PLP-dependent aminotransferase family protein [Oscillospiraceae bacterium]|nr:PLP-dependent aminotransferase family protein [Oscillospiraceae bacterium]